MRATLTLWLTALLGIGCGSEGDHLGPGAGGNSGLGASSSDNSGSRTRSPAEASSAASAPVTPHPEAVPPHPDAVGGAPSIGGRGGTTNGGNGDTTNGGSGDNDATAPGGATNGGSDTTSLGGNSANPTDDDPPDMDPESGGGPATDAGGQTLSFATDIWPVFDQARDPPFVYPGAGSFGGCTVVGVCHGGDRPGARLSMTDAETAYDALLEVPSVSSLCDGTIRVVPGEPEESCLILFYEGRLRDELDWVDDAEIDRVREWITQGALP